MSKEYLEALERLYCSGNLQLDYVLNNKHKQDYEIIEKALQRLESIDNAKPSEALKCLEKANDYLNNVYDYKEIKEEVRNDINTIKQALLKAQEDEEENKRLWNDITTISKQYTDLMLEYQEQEKVLEIIKKKEVRLWQLRVSTDLESYNYHCLEEEELTEEEFDLLKRYFK